MDNVSVLENNVTVVKAIADVLKTTLGPRGMDKMLIDNIGDIVITNDGATIIKEVELRHPAAKVIGEVAKSQEEEIGDGTTSAVVLAGELLKNALELIRMGVHSSIIIKGYESALNESLRLLDEKSVKIKINDDKTLLDIIKTSINGKSVEGLKDALTDLILNAVKTVSTHGRLDVNDIKIEKKPGESINESMLIKGVLIDREPAFTQMNREISKAGVLLIDSALEVKTLTNESEIEIKNPLQLVSYKNKEAGMLKELVELIAGTGANVVICQKGIDDEAQQQLLKKGITALRRVRKSDMDLLSKALGVRLINNLKEATSSDVSQASLSVKKLGDEYMTIIHNCANPKAVTILLRGAQDKLIDEFKRSIEDALGNLRTIFSDGRIVYGAGATELMLRNQLLKHAQKCGGREQLSIKAFADALEIIPKSLIENFGNKVIDLMPKAINASTKGIEWGVGEAVINAKSKGIIEPLLLKKHVLTSAYEASRMILRVDDVIIKAGRNK